MKAKSAAGREKKMSKWMWYDFFGREWNGFCASCNQELHAPTKSEYIANRLYHTRNICGGGY